MWRVIIILLSMLSLCSVAMASNSQEKVSLNFQDIEVRSVLQLLAGFTGLNIIVTDAVQGNITLHLDNIPWTQALDFILTSKGLSKLESGNILLISVGEEMPIKSEYIQINYAKAADLLTMIKSAQANLLSARGQISSDVRTNTLLIKDTAVNIANIKDLLQRLDVSVRQVMIEVQIVHTSDTLRDALGIKLGSAATAQLGKYTLHNNLSFDFAATNFNSMLGLALAKLPGGTLLDLELQAAEFEETAKTIARPKLLTLDQQQASIETGEEIPYATVSKTGATPTTTFKKAVLKLDVTPQITPDNKIAMAITVNQDTPIGAGAEPAISTTAMTTNVLVDDGETIVLGGIFKVTDSLNKRKVPYLSKIPLVGRLFNASAHNMERVEILIFVTPRIAKELDKNH